jgi:hypothetical protein
MAIAPAAPRASAHSSAHWCIAVGIDGYPFLPRLPAAAADAIALKGAWRSGGELGDRRCLLLSDHSAPVEGYPTYPNRENLRYWLRRVTETWVQPGDLLWVFLSGYGVSAGGRDYFLPVEANPSRPLDGALGFGEIYDFLAPLRGRAENILVLLDIHRGWPDGSLGAAGAEIETLARALGIPTLLASGRTDAPSEPGTVLDCPSPFGAAIAQLLAQPPSHNLFGVQRWLTERLRAEDGRSPQVIVEPPEMIYGTVLVHRCPELSDAPSPYILFPAGTALPPGMEPIAARSGEPGPEGDPENDPKNGSGEGPRSPDPDPDLAPDLEPELDPNPDREPETPPAPDQDQGDLENSPPPEAAIAVDGDNQGRVHPTAPEPPQSPTLDSPSEQIEIEDSDPVSDPLPTQSEPTVSETVLVTNLVTNSGSKSADDGDAIAPFLPDPDPIPPTWTARLTTVGSSLLQTLNAMSQNPRAFNPSAADSQFARNVFLWGGFLIVLLLGGVLLRNRADLMAPPRPQPANGLEPPLGEVPNLPPAQLADLARQHVEQGKFADAVAVVDAIPPEAQTPAVAETRRQALQRIDDDRLAQARIPIRISQASEFNKAIQQARAIPANDPLYPQAQQDIDRWSRVILDLAEGRARSGQFGAAIAAAQLIPADRAALHSQAQNAIRRWQTQQQQQASNRQILQQAIAVVEPGSASSYSRAIGLAAAVPAGQPEHFRARALREQWSDAILKIAYGRANQNQLDGAIAAAQLIPANTAAHSAARQAIKIWQNRKG